MNHALASAQQVHLNRACQHVRAGGCKQPNMTRCGSGSRADASSNQAAGLAPAHAWAYARAQAIQTMLIKLQHPGSHHPLARYRALDHEGQDVAQREG